MTARRDPAEALLIDLDGVLRIFDPAASETAERTHGLPPGSLIERALAWPRLLPAITGAQTHEEWLTAVAVDLTEVAGGPEQASAAVLRWQADRGVIVPEVLDFVRQTRSAGLPVVLATNATSRLDADLTELGLAEEFDAVVNSSVIGVPKPSREFFFAACAAVRTSPGRCLFIDDDDRAVRGARVAGLSAYRWNGPTDLPYLRSALALPR